MLPEESSRSSRWLRHRIHQDGAWTRPVRLPDNVIAEHGDGPKRAYVHAALERVAVQVRAGDWWDHKFAPIFAIFYATCIHIGTPIAPLWSAMLLLLFACIPGAIYASLINDWTDTAHDLAAGKRNQLFGRSRSWVAAALGGCVLAGTAFFWHWRHDPMLAAVYLGPWIAFTLYSGPPARLKERGLLGLIADSAGSHGFPAMLAALLTYSAAGRPADVLWVATVGLWAFAYGLRGILWHQLLDAEADRKAGVNTFVYKHGESRAILLGTRLLAPLELVSILLLLRQIDSIFPVLALGLYYLSSTLRVDWHRLSPTIVARKERPLLVGKDYYDLFLPAALLLASIFTHPFDALVLAAHLVCFYGRTKYLLVQIRDAAQRIRSRKYSWK